MLVRQATTSDAHRIAEIHVETWRVAYRGQLPDAILDKLDVEKRATFWHNHLVQQPQGVFVAELNQRIAGFCDLIPSRDRNADPKTTAEIAAIYVHPNYWRNGAGRALWGRAREMALQEKRITITLWVLTSNRSARNFYEAMGFSLDCAVKVDQFFGDNYELHEVRYRVSI